MAARIKHLRQEKADLLNEAHGLIDTARDAGRDLSETQRTRSAQISQRLGALAGELLEEERMLDLERMGGTTSDRTQPLPAEQAARVARHHETVGGRHDTGTRLRRGRSYAAMFGASAGSDLGGFTSGAEFLSIVGQGLHDTRLRVAAATMNEAVGSEGGFAVPAHLSARWLDLALEQEICPAARECLADDHARTASAGL